MVPRDLSPVHDVKQGGDHLLPVSRRGRRKERGMRSEEGGGRREEGGGGTCDAVR